MRQICSRALALACLVFTAGIALADGGNPPAPPSPLRLLPAEADLVVQLQRPARLVEVLSRLDLVAQLGKLALVKNQLDSTQGRRGRQLLAHFEKALGMKWQQALERLASGGAAAGLKFGDGAPAVLVIQGDDEKLLDRFLAAIVEVLQGELARQESKEKLDKGDYLGITGYKIGNLLFARVGTALVVTNKKEAMARAIHLHQGKDKKSILDQPALAESAKLLPEVPLASLWFNMAPVHKSPQGKALYKSPRDDPQLTVLFGAYLDLLGRAPYLCASLSEEKDGFLLTGRAPRGTDGMGPDRELHLPPEGAPAGRPLLEPKGVLYSTGFYRDISRIWKDREKLFTKTSADNLAKSDKSSGPFLAGIKLSTMLESVGARHRLVVVNPAKRPYKREPLIRIPAFAVVAELRQAEKFGRSMDTLLRAAALFATDTFKMEMVEEKYAGVDLVGYRFDEKAEVKDDVNDVRYNFTPCFARVKDQFLFCSTAELCKELIDVLVAEEKSPGKGEPSAGRDKLYAEGFAELLRSIDDQLITQTILDQAVAPGDAKKQVDEVIAFVRGLGALTAESRFEAKRFRYDVRLTLKR